MARLRRATFTASLDPAAWMPADEARRIYDEVTTCQTPDDLARWLNRWPRPWPFGYPTPVAILYWQCRAGAPPADYDPHEYASQVIACVIAHRRAQALGADDDGWKPDRADVRTLLARSAR